MPLIIATKVLESFEISVTLRNIFTKYKALWTSQLAPFLYVVFSFDTLISSTNIRVHAIPFTLMWCSFLCFDSCHWTLLLSRVKVTFEVIFPPEYWYCIYIVKRTGDWNKVTKSRFGDLFLDFIFFWEIQKWISDTRRILWYFSRRKWLKILNPSYQTMMYTWWLELAGCRYCIIIWDCQIEQFYHC